MEFIHPMELAYNNYVKWEESGGKELKLPGFFLTNRQMFWVASAHAQYYKFHFSNKLDERYENNFRFFHRSFRNVYSFQEAFNCSKNLI